MIRGITVTLLQLSRSGSSEAWVPTDVDNVLVAPVMEVDSNVAMLHEGHRAVYHLAIPKSDAHDWEGQLVQFWGSTWSVIGIPTKGIDDLIPGPWNTKVTVELYRSAAPDLDSLWCDRVQLISWTATTDSEGYEDVTPLEPRTVNAIFCEGVNASRTADGEKSGLRLSATVELWAGDYAGETRIHYKGCPYDVQEISRTGRGTLLLKLEEVWR